jgi:hypothetical protein
MFSIRTISSKAANAETEPAVRTLDRTLTVYRITPVLAIHRIGEEEYDFGS